MTTQSAKVSGVLYVVATPLGNAGDLSPRAIETLRAADIILAEDTRTAKRLLAVPSAGSRAEPPILSCFDANEDARADEAAAWLQAGKNVAFVSEAGTPAISDPGFRIVRAAIQVGARIVPVPGPSAVLAALVASGLGTDRFFFAGFPPRKSGARRTFLAQVQALPATLIFYESPLRAAATLADMAAVFGPDRAGCVARELTKTHEEFVRGTLAGLAQKYDSARPLGEVTIVVAGASATPPMGESDLRARASELLREGHSAKDAAHLLAQETGASRRDAYAAVLALKG